MEILKDRMVPEQAEKLARILTEGHWTHDYPITCEKLRDLFKYAASCRKRSIR